MMVVKSEDGRELRSFRFKDEDESQEFRAVERQMFLETLASQFPPNTISFSSKIKNIEKSKNDETLLKLEDDSQISDKIVIACDGTRSPVAKWMDFPDPSYFGHCAIRGIGFHPAGQPVEPKVSYVYVRGVRACYLPISSTKVYWFACINSPSPGFFFSWEPKKNYDTVDLGWSKLSYMNVHEGKLLGCSFNQSCVRRIEPYANGSTAGLNIHLEPKPHYGGSTILKEDHVKDGLGRLSVSHNANSVKETKPITKFSVQQNSEVSKDLKSFSSTVSAPCTSQRTSYLCLEIIQG